MSKKVEKEQAMALRKRGFGYKEIAKMVGVSVSTVSLWLKDEAWSHEVTKQNQKRAARDNSKRISLLNKARGNQFKKLYGEAERSAVTEFKHYKTAPLFVSGLVIYRLQGVHTGASIRLSTSDIEIHRMFLHFLREYLGVSRETIRIQIALSPAHSPLVCTKEWSKQLKIPVIQFHKYQVIQGNSSKSKSKSSLQYGIGNTIIGSAVLKKKLMKWIELSIRSL